MLKYTVFSLILLASTSYAMERSNSPMSLGSLVGYYVGTAIQEGIPRATNYTSNAMINPSATYSQLSPQTARSAVWGSMISKVIFSPFGFR